MEDLQIRLAEKGGKSVYPEIPINKCVWAKVSKVAIMQTGTARGRTTVQLVGETEDGNFLVLETTARLLNGIMNATKGAAIRWGDDLNEP